MHFLNEWYKQAYLKKIRESIEGFSLYGKRRKGENYAFVL